MLDLSVTRTLLAVVAALPASWLLVACEVASPGFSPLIAPDTSEVGRDTIVPADGAPGSSDITDSLSPSELVEPDTSAPPEPPIPEDLAATLQAIVGAHLDGVEAPGVTVGVRLPDGGWWEGGAGEACPDPAVSITPGRRYRTGSVTKTFVSAAILQLVSEGAMGLDDPVDSWVTGFDLGPEVTVRRLLNHTSGLYNPADDGASIQGNISEPIDPRELVAMALEHPREFLPGTGWSYSNTNYILAGLVIEAVTGEPVDAALRARLLEPLGLTDTYLEGAEAAPAAGEGQGLVCGYIVGVEVTYAMDMSWAWTAGAMVSSALDLCDWAEALVRGEVVPQPLRDAMQANTELPDGASVSYGLGLRWRQRGGLAVVGHGGSTWGFESEVYIDPVSGLCVVGLANAFSSEPTAVTRPVWDALVDALGL